MQPGARSRWRLCHPPRPAHTAASQVAGCGRVAAQRLGTHDMRGGHTEVARLRRAQACEPGAAQPNERVSRGFPTTTCGDASFFSLWTASATPGPPGHTCTRSPSALAIVPHPSPAWGQHCRSDPARPSPRCAAALPPLAFFDPALRTNPHAHELPPAPHLRGSLGRLQRTSCSSGVPCNRRRREARAKPGRNRSPEPGGSSA